MTVRVFGDADEQWQSGNLQTLNRDESHYLCRVRRARVHTNIEVFDQRGGIWQASVVEADPKASQIRLESPLVVADPPRRVTLLLGITATPALLDGLTRASEVGADSIILVQMQRSQGNGPAPDRIIRVLRAAQRQCGRPLPPTVTRGESLDACAYIDQNSWDLFAWTGSRTTHFDSAPHGRPARLVIGPEGGMTDNEVQMLQTRGFEPLGLGPWIQRSETAVATGIARVIFA